MKIYNYIYLITNNINSKIYIGKHSTDNIDDDYMGSGKLIKKAIQKYGIENFTKEYLAFCDTEEKLNWLEKFYIKKYKAREVGYNLTDGGDGTIGYKYTDKAKQKMSEARKKYHHSEESKRKISESLKCHKVAEDTKQKMSEAKLGKHFLKLSEACKGKTKPKYKWLTPTGEIIEMTKTNAHRCHPNWKLIEQV